MSATVSNQHNPNSCMPRGDVELSDKNNIKRALHSSDRLKIKSNCHITASQSPLQCLMQQHSHNITIFERCMDLNGSRVEYQSQFFYVSDKKRSRDELFLVVRFNYDPFWRLTYVR